MPPVLKKIVALLVILIVANVGFMWYGQASFDATFQSLAKAFAENNATMARHGQTPPAIAKHLEQSRVRTHGYKTLLLQMDGLYRKKPSSKPIEMHALALLRPFPDMLWAVRMKSNPLVTFNALETYHAGRATMQTMLFGIVPTGTFDSETFARSELARLLAYALFNPALLECGCIDYEPIDERHTRAAIHDGNLTAAVVFESDMNGRIVKVTSRHRARPGKQGLQPSEWQMTVLNYGDFDGLKLPKTVEESWIVEGNPLVYSRYDIASAKRL